MDPMDIHIYISFSEIYPLILDTEKNMAWKKSEAATEISNAENSWPEYIIHVTLFLCFQSFHTFGPQNHEKMKLLGPKNIGYNYP